MAGFIQIFGTSIMKATLLDTKTKHYRFTAPQWMKRFEAQFPVQVSNYAKFGSTIEKGSRIFYRVFTNISCFAVRDVL